MSDTPIYRYWTPEMRLREGRDKPGLFSGRREAGRPAVGSDIAVLENSESVITVASHIGERYSFNTEAAYVRIALPKKGAAQIGRITAAREADFAAGTPALQDALRCAEQLAAERGVVVLECRSSPEFAGLSNEAVKSLLTTLDVESYQITYQARLSDGRREWVFPKREGQGEIHDTVEDFECKKNLRVTPPEAPEHGVYARDLDERKLLEQLGQIENTGKPPEQLDLPPAAQDALAKLWADSSQPGQYREAGAYLVIGADGRLKMGPESQGELLSVAAARGAGGSVELVWPAEGDAVVGQMHTHPYLDGLDGMSYSGQDVVALLLTPEAHVSLVRSGDTIFALARAPEARMPTSQEIDLIRRGAQAEFEMGCYQRGARRPDGQPTFQDMREAALDASVSQCRARHLALYAGQAGRPLKRIYP